MALIVNSRPFAPSRFFNSLADSDPFAAVWVRNGMHVEGRRRGVSVDSTRATLQLTYDMELSIPDTGGQIGTDLQIDLKGRLSQSGCRIVERHSLEDTGLRYDSGSTDGNLWTFAEETADRHWRILLLVTESRK